MNPLQGLLSLLQGQQAPQPGQGGVLGHGAPAGLLGDPGAQNSMFDIENRVRALMRAYGFPEDVARRKVMDMIGRRRLPPGQAVDPNAPPPQRGSWPISSVRG